MGDKGNTEQNVAVSPDTRVAAVGIVHGRAASAGRNNSLTVIKSTPHLETLIRRLKQTEDEGFV